MGHVATQAVKFVYLNPVKLWALLLQVAGHFEILPGNKEMLNPTPLWQISKQKTLNHAKEHESKQCQWLVGIFRCKEVETEAIYIRTKSRHCNVMQPLIWLAVSFR